MKSVDRLQAVVSDALAVWDPESDDEIAPGTRVLLLGDHGGPIPEGHAKVGEPIWPSRNTNHCECGHEGDWHDHIAGLRASTLGAVVVGHELPLVGGSRKHIILTDRGGNLSVDRVALVLGELMPAQPA